MNTKHQTNLSLRYPWTLIVQSDGVKVTTTTFYPWKTQTLHPLPVIGKEGG